MTIKLQRDILLPLEPSINPDDPKGSLENQQKFNRELLNVIKDMAEDIHGDINQCFGEIYAKDNAVTTTLNNADHVQITVFDTNGFSNSMSPDHTNDHIKINKRALYLVTVSIVLQNNAAQKHKPHVELAKNNGSVFFDNVHAHRTLAGGSTDVGSMSLSGIIKAEVGDTLELWADTDVAADRSVTFEDVTLSVMELKN